VYTCVCASKQHKEGRQGFREEDRRAAQQYCRQGSYLGGASTWEHGLPKNMRDSVTLQHTGCRIGEHAHLVEPTLLKEELEDKAQGT